MVFFFSLISAIAIAVGALAVPASVTEYSGLLARDGTPSAIGISNGYYYSWSTDGAAHANYTNGPAGQYSINWAGEKGNIIGGKGWNPGSARTVNYSGVYNPDGNSYLALYGWTRNPLIEYYIVESYGSYDPSSDAERIGIVNCDGAAYVIFQITRVNQPSIEGTQTFQQYWSVRIPRKSTGSISGTVTTACHFNAWSKLGMKLGNHDIQIFATGGYSSSGNSTISVS